MPLDTQIKIDRPVREIFEDYSTLKDINEKERKHFNKDIGYTSDLFVYTKSGEDILLNIIVPPQADHQKEKFSIEEAVSKDAKNTIYTSKLDLQDNGAKSYGHITVSIPKLRSGHNDNEQTLIQRIFDGNAVNLYDLGIKSIHIVVPKKETILAEMERTGKDRVVLPGYLRGFEHRSKFIAGYIKTD